MTRKLMKRSLTIIAVVIVLFAVAQSLKIIPQFGTKNKPSFDLLKPGQKVEFQESIVTKVIEDSLPSVVTVGISKTLSTKDSIEINPGDPFSPFKRIPGETKEIEQNIGSGFIISEDGLIITNRHVVSDGSATYSILTNDNKKYDVAKIYRDPLNDLAILKVNKNGLKPLPLGDSSGLKLGQLVIAIGTPLGEFTNTVTTGIISGLGRGITAGSPFEGFVEKLDNVIQTDAAISAGNSGGPLLNSSGQVIGVNTAIAQEAQNIGFAIPVNTIKTLLEDFKKRGSSFERPFLGVRYKIIDRKTAVANDLAEGAYILEVIDDSPADKASLREEDVIIEFDAKKITSGDDQLLTRAILQKKIGDTVILKVWRQGQTYDARITLEASNL